MWRVRVRAEAEEQEGQSFEFDSRKFMPRLDPLVSVEVSFISFIMISQCGFK